MVDVKIAYWLWQKLGAYIIRREKLTRPAVETVAVQLPGLLFVDGTWMPDRAQAIVQ